ncbi:MAG: hypothetical protein ACM3JB_13370 [Acidobacteriaceae bacterium]
MAKVFVIPSRPSTDHLKRHRSPDPAYIEGQRLLVQAMSYLVKSDPEANRSALELLSEHVRTKFRMSDSPLKPQ